MFVIQKGDHAQERYLSVKILSMTGSVITLLLFVYYGNDITAKMTVGAPDNLPRTFGDVLDRGYNLVPSYDLVYHLMGSTSQHKKGYTSKNKLYQKFFEAEYRTKIEPFEKAKNNLIEESKKSVTSIKTTEARNLVFELEKKVPYWYVAANSQGRGAEWAHDIIMKEPNTLWYCTRSPGCMTPRVRGKIKALEMEDDAYTYQSFILQRNSEYLPMFNYYLLRQHEHGIINRLKNYHGDPKDENFEISEPFALGMIEVLFPFSVLGLSIIISVGVAATEKLIKMFNAHTTRKSKVRF